ncbi:MAG: dCMP deaminase [Rhodospirillaceae bacterium]|nr:dCMP deaminase [Rhodospirillales bacterium]MBT3904405.1 dCMP deaminase [Rhodospirillaceae bacterium]MBT4702635.1 dCMP deaminase [Rhodospirillaceae bacterium]MBT5035405.1 dCMP deaminase [Rhodospirillaceae bacterium]MBT6221946.1 dCMP deaminase [Rhodospirillaceae bacterium]
MTLSAPEIDALDQKHLARAAQLGLECPASDGSFSVGAVLTDSDGQEISTGYTREFGDSWHAEQVALEKAARDGIDPAGGWMYSSLEPCGNRLSGNVPCVQRIIDAKLSRVIYAEKEPPIFVTGVGHDLLREQGLDVVQLEGFKEVFRQANKHLLEKS